MEGLLTNYYEYHFLYITGIHHVESKNIQGVALMKLYFHPGTDMAQAMAETVGYVNRSRAFMPPGTVPPFVMRFDTGSVPVGYLVLSSDNRRPSARSRTRRCSRCGRCSPACRACRPRRRSAATPRTIVVRVDPDRLRAYNMSPDEVVAALTVGQHDQPVGQHPHQRPHADRAGQRDGRAAAGAGQDSRSGPASNVYLRDVGVIEDSTDIADRLRPGQRPAGRLHPGHQAGRRLDADGRQRGEGQPAEDAGRAARRHQGQLRVRPVALRHRRHRRTSASRGCSARC